ncbi:hypothetical protein VPH159E362A_0022 [Vibrio phage 159E36-2a]
MGNKPVFTEDEREEFVRCIGHGYQDGRKNVSWCGGSDRPFFINARHASLNGLNQGRLISCPECVEAILKALSNGYDEFGGNV